MNRLSGTYQNQRSRWLVILIALTILAVFVVGGVAQTIAKAGGLVSRQGELSAVDAVLLLKVLGNRSSSSGKLYVGYGAGGTITDLDERLFNRLRRVDPDVMKASKLKKLGAKDRFVLDTVSRPKWKIGNVATISSTRYTSSGSFGESPYAFAQKNGRWAIIDSARTVSCGAWRRLEVCGTRIIPRSH